MSFAHLLTEQVYVSEPSGVNAYGEPSWGAPVLMNAAVEHGFTTVLDFNGDETVSAASMAIGTEISHKSRVWLDVSEVADETKARIPISVTSAKSRISGLTLWEVFF